MSTQQVEAHLNYFQTLTARSLASAEQIIALNISTARASMEKSSAAVQQLFAVKDPRDLLAFTTSTQDNFESLLAYGRKLADIASGVGLNLAVQEAEPFEAPAAPAQKTVSAEPAEPAALPVKAKPVAKAVPPQPAAAPFPIVVKGVKPADAVKPAAEPKQLDMLVPKPKASKKK
ncbi:MAG: phasin family protein [Pseudomonadota bacterium]